MEDSLAIGTPLFSAQERRRALTEQAVALGLATSGAGSSSKSWRGERDRRGWVVDELGRRVLHGAFTGGSFPTETSSSSSSSYNSSFLRNDNLRDSSGRLGLTQRPEDFMDEEDMAFQRGRLHANEMYAPAALTSASYPSSSSSSTSTTSVLLDRQHVSGIEEWASKIELVLESFGKRIMKQLGWRDGTGIGPRRRVGLSGKRVLEDGSVQVDEWAAGRTFAPSDVPSMRVKYTADKRGLGCRVDDAGFSKLWSARRDVDDGEEDEGYLSSAKLHKMEQRLEEGRQREAGVVRGNPFAGYVLANKSEPARKAFETVSSRPFYPRDALQNDPLRKSPFEFLQGELCERFVTSAKEHEQQSQDQTNETHPRTAQTKERRHVSRIERSWRPESIVCKRFGVSIPSTSESGELQNKPERMSIKFDNISDTWRSQDELRQPLQASLVKSIFEPHHSEVVDTEEYEKPEASTGKGDVDSRTLSSLSSTLSENTTPAKILFKRRAERQSIPTTSPAIRKQTVTIPADDGMDPVLLSQRHPEALRGENGSETGSETSETDDTEVSKQSPLDATKRKRQRSPSRGDRRKGHRKDKKAKKQDKKRKKKSKKKEKKAKSQRHHRSDERRDTKRHRTHS